MFIKKLFAAVLLCLCCVSCAQADEVQSSAEKSVSYVIDTVKVTEKFTVAENEVLWVRNGGVLYIDTDAALDILGSINVAEGGEVYIRGKADIRDSGELNVSGKVKVIGGGTVGLSGRLRVNHTGIVKGEGTIVVRELFSDIECGGTVTAKIQPPEPVQTDGVTYVGGIILVNKTYSLPSTYGSGVSDEAYAAYVRMKNDSGYEMEIISDYRSYEMQREAFARWCELDGYEEASMYSAQAGHSEHQTGLAFDITSLEETYADTEEGRWLAANCHNYGFIIRYPENKSEILGYTYEPWHIRYLGESTARLVHDSGLTLEEFFCVK